MGIFDRLRSKEVTQEQVGDYFATSVKAPQVSPIGRRPSMSDLSARYGMLVHRCVTINATTAASIQPRLFAIGNAETLTKARGLHPKPLDKHTKDFMRGRMSVSPSSSVVRKIKGNLSNIVELESHPVLDLFDDVNDHQEGIGFREGFYSDLQIFGRNFTLLVRDGSKQPTSMWRLLPQMMKVIPGKEQFLSHFEYGGGADKVKYEPDDVFWVRVYDPSDPYGEFRRLFGRMVNRQDTIAILSGEAELKPLQRAPRELQTVEQEKYTIEALSIAFGVPKSLLTTDDVNLANAREGSITHARNTILPMLRRFEDAVNQRLLPLWSDRLFLMHDNPIREDREIRIKERPSQLAAGYTVNEIRLADDLEPLDMPAADTPMIAANLIPLGAPQVEQQEAEMIEESKSITIDEPCCKEHADDSSFSDLMDVANYKAWPGIEEDWSNDYDRGLQRIYAKVLKQAASAVKKSAAPWVVKDRALRIGDSTLIMAELDLDGFSAEIYDISHKNIKSTVGESGQAAMVELGERVQGADIAFDIDNSNTLAVIERSSARIAQHESVEVAKTIRHEVGKNIKLGGTVAELSQRFQAMAMPDSSSWSSNKAEMVARTETMIAKNEGRNDAWKQSRVVKGKKFLIAPHACDLCKAVDKQMGGIIDLDSTLNGNVDTITYSGGKTYNFGTYRPFTTPPVHPNCRCTLEPVTFSADEIADMLMSEDN